MYGDGTFAKWLERAVARSATAQRWKRLGAAGSVVSNLVIGEGNEKARGVGSGVHAVEQRGENYGDVRENHQRIASMWSVVLGQDVTPEQVKPADLSQGG